jgi:pimeloyl-ACP methyl ester carboxylesterase
MGMLADLQVWLFAALGSSFFLAPRALLAAEQAWPADYTAAIDVKACNQFPNSAWLPRPLSSGNPKGGKFSLFYAFNHQLDPRLPTALFVDGGPGAIFSPARMPMQERVSDDAWNVVYFHIRGAGCSQIPASTSYDRFLTIAAAIDDMESLRDRLKLNSWDLVMGESFGSWLAGRYAFSRPKSVSRLLLEGAYNPLWAEDPKSGSAAIHDSMAAKAIVAIAKRGQPALLPGLTAQEIEGAGEQLVKIQAEIDAVREQSGFDRSVLLTMPAKAGAEAQKLRRFTAYSWSQFGVEFFQALYMAPYLGAVPLRPSLTRGQDNVAIGVFNSLFPGRVEKARVEEAKTTVMRTFLFDDPGAPLFPMLSERASYAYWRDLLKGKSDRPIATPTIYVNGDLDGATPLAGAEDIAQKICHGPCLFVVVEGGGHSATNLAKECVEQFLQPFIRDDLAAAAEIINRGPACQAHAGVQAQRVNNRYAQ